jgi:hypothetical protein
MVPFGNAYPFLNMMGNITYGWLLFWQAGIAQRRLSAILSENRVDESDKKAVKAFVKEHRDASFYQGKVMSARFYARHILPQAKAVAESIKTEDMSFLSIADESFAQ